VNVEGNGELKKKSWLSQWNLAFCV